MVRKGFVVLIIIGLIVSMYFGVKDFQMQTSAEGVLLTLDYTSVKEYAKETGLSIEETLMMAKKANITHISLSEMRLRVKENDLESFADQEAEISAYLGKDVASLKYSDIEWTKLISFDRLKVDNYYLISKDESRINQIAVSATEKYGRDKINIISDDQNFILEIVVDPGMSINGLGFDSKEIDLIESLGLKVIPRPLNATFNGAQLDNYMRYIEELFNAEVIIFAGDNGVVGNRIRNSDNLISQTAQNLYPYNKNGMIYGYVEMTTITGDKELARRLKYEMARVHSIGKDEWDKRYNTYDTDQIKVGEVIERYALAVNDRSINVLYLRLFDKGLDFNESYFNNLNEKLANQGYNLGSISTIPTRDNLPKIASILLFIGLGGALAILFLNVFENQVKIAVGLLVLGSIASIALTVSGYQNLINQLGAFLSAIIFPSLGIIWGYIKTKGYQEGLKQSLISFTKAISVSLIGGLYVHAFLASASYMTSIEVFPMVKIALLAPLAVVAFMYIIQKDAIKGITEFMEMKIRVYHLAILGIGFVALLLIAMRSGNNPIIPVTSFEIKLRLFLQSNLTARPRFKEFAIGYPLLIVAGAFLNSKFSKVAIILGTIGLSNLVNTFAHLHKPVRMAMFTTINGIIAGVVVGLIGYIIIKKGIDLWRVNFE